MGRTQPLFTARVHDRVPFTTRVQDRSRPRTSREHGRVNSPCTAGTQVVYTPCLRPVPVFTDTAVYTDCKRAVYTAVNARVHVPCTVYTAVFTALVHGRRRPLHGRYTTEAEAKAETDDKAEAKVIVTTTVSPWVFDYGRW